MILFQSEEENKLRKNCVAQPPPAVRMKPNLHNFGIID